MTEEQIRAAAEEIVIDIRVEIDAHLAGERSGLSLYQIVGRVAQIIKKHADGPPEEE